MLALSRESLFLMGYYILRGDFLLNESYSCEVETSSKRKVRIPRFARFQKTKLQTNESKQVMKNVRFICSSFMYVFTMVASKDDDSAVTLAAEDVV
jgi:hypothetical protein